MSRERKGLVPTTRRLTDKLQVNGYRMLVSRQEQGLIARDVRGFSWPYSRELGAFVTGMGLAGLILAAALVLSLFSPASRPGDAKILASKAGARFVVVDGRAHPVTNLSSARLITGSPEDSKTVSDSELAKFPRGMLMGIPGAPDDMDARTDDTARWVACSQFDASTDLSLTRQQAVTTIVIGGNDAVHGAQPVPDNTALLVSADVPAAEQGDDEDSPTKQLWLLYAGHRIPVADSSSGLRSVLNINADTTSTSAKDMVTVSTAVLDTIPEQKPFDAPSLSGSGSSSKALPQYEVGSVVTTKGVGDEENWLVLDDGVQRIGPFAAQLLVAQGASVSNDVSASEIAGAPHRSTVDFSGWPWAVPQVVNAPDTVCYDWQRKGEAAAQSHLLAGPGVPMTADDRASMTTLLPPKGHTVQADKYYSRPGRGWLAVATGETPSSHTAGQLWWISDSGVRYAIGGEGSDDITKVIKALGVNGVEPQRIPWSILQLLPAGPTLSPSAAKVEHATLPVDMAQQPVNSDDKSVN